MYAGMAIPPSSAALCAPLQRVEAMARVALIGGPTPIEELVQFSAAIGGPRILVKRDDAIPFAFGGNKTRKMEFVAADALAAGADTLVTVGGVQSNHARATMATAAKLGLKGVLIANGEKPVRPTANALLDELLGADIEYIATRAERAQTMVDVIARLQAEGRTPYAVPLGASTPLGSLGYVRAVGEMLAQMDAPDVIVHATSSAGTHAGIVAGCALHGVPTRVIGVSADDPSRDIEERARDIVRGIAMLLDCDDEVLRSAPVSVDEGFIGDGYGIPSAASHEAQRLAAQIEALFVDHTYTAKALAALIAYVRAGRFAPTDTVLFWHTGGQVGLFA